MRFTFRIALALIALVSLNHVRADNRIDIAGDGSDDVVLIPGLAVDGRALQPIAEFLSRCHRTHTFTLAGFAGQPADSHTSSDTWIDSIDRYIANLERHRAIIIGHGAGGALALKLALAHPQHVERLIILDALPYPPVLLMRDATAQSVRAEAAEARQKTLAESAESFRASQERALAALTNHPERVPALVEWSLASDRRVLADAYYEWLTMDLRSEIGQIEASTLVLVPWDVSQPQDTATTLDLYRKQYASLATAQVKVIKGARHFMTFDQPIATNWAIEEFLGKCPAL